jgi:hypothetical protein
MLNAQRKLVKVNAQKHAELNNQIKPAKVNYAKANLQKHA